MASIFLSVCVVKFHRTRSKQRGVILDEMGFFRGCIALCVSVRDGNSLGNLHLTEGRRADDLLVVVQINAKSSNGFIKNAFSEHSTLGVCVHVFAMGAILKVSDFYSVFSEFIRHPQITM